MLENELGLIIDFAKKFKKRLTREQAFNILILQYYCFKEVTLEKIWYELTAMITDGANDGGIDFIYFDEDENKIIIAQNKYSSNIEVNDVVAEINKIVNTIKDFEKYKTGAYSNELKDNLQNCLDRLTEETAGNIDIIFTSKAAFSHDKVMQKVEDSMEIISNIEFLDHFQIEDIMSKVKLQDEIVEEAALNIDKTKNFLEYSAGNLEGIFVNVSSSSLINIFNKYQSKGLFNLNIRKYVRKKSVDDGINYTLNNEREKFWFLNNGLTIACNDFRIDGNKVKIYNFSIVNGGQTTTLIGNYKGKNIQEFYIPCKIIKSTENLDNTRTLSFFNKIAEATNSQKPILPKDLKSNAPEMRTLQNTLADEGISLDIKRGEKQKKNNNIKIKNDELAQIIYSFKDQKPGTSRSNKNSLFSNNTIYTTIFKQPYSRNEDMKNFLIDLIKLNDRYTVIAEKLKKNEDNLLNKNELNIFRNGKMVIFSLFGVIYRLVNKDCEATELKDDPTVLYQRNFVYGSFLSNYKENDLDKKIEELIKEFLDLLEQEYQNQFDNTKVTSVSNFFKTDKKYLSSVVSKFAKEITKREKNYDTFVNDLGVIFKREN